MVHARQNHIPLRHLLKADLLRMNAVVVLAGEGDAAGAWG